MPFSRVFHFFHYFTSLSKCPSQQLSLSPGRSPSWEACAGVASELVGTIAAGAPKRSGESNMSRWWFQFFFIFITTWGKIPILTNIFQMGWNHQLDVVTGRFTEKYWNTQFFRWILGGWKPAAESDSSLHGYGANLKKSPILFELLV